jgi:hypothetical protein
MIFAVISVYISVVQEFGAGVRIRPDFANPAKVQFGRISGTKFGHFLDHGEGIKKLV